MLQTCGKRFYAWLAKTTIILWI